MSGGLSPAALRALTRLDTCSVANAIETFGLRLRNEGFSGAALRCFTPQLPPAVGYAETLRVRSSSLGAALLLRPHRLVERARHGPPPQDPRDPGRRPEGRGGRLRGRRAR